MESHFVVTQRQLQERAWACEIELESRAMAPCSRLPCAYRTAVARLLEMFDRKHPLVSTR